MVASQTPDTGTPSIAKTVPVSDTTTLPNAGLANTGLPGVVLIWAAVLAVLAIGLGLPLVILCRRADDGLTDTQEFMQHQHYDANARPQDVTPALPPS